MATQFDVEGVLGSSPPATVTLVFIVTGDCNASAESSLSCWVTAYSTKQRYGQKLEITLLSNRHFIKHIMTLIKHLFYF